MGHHLRRSICCKYSSMILKETNQKKMQRALKMAQKSQILFAIKKMFFLAKLPCNILSTFASWHYTSHHLLHANKSTAVRRSREQNRTEHAAIAACAPVILDFEHSCHIVQ